MTEYAGAHKPETWRSLKHWAEWWKRPKHLGKLVSNTSLLLNVGVNVFYIHTGMLCGCYSTNEVFDTVPNSTNAVESHNRASKGSSPNILKVALMSTYKVDMAAALEHLANSQGISTSYDNLHPAARAKRTKVANKARSRKRAGADDTDGPPDKCRDFKKGKCTCCYAAHVHVYKHHSDMYVHDSFLYSHLCSQGSSESRA